MSKYKATCHTKCYWLETIWNIDDVYEGEIKPNRHFYMEGEPAPEKPPEMPSEGPSYDPRSTRKLKDALARYMKVPTNWSRKKIWSELKNREISESKDELTNPEIFVATCGFKAKSQAGLNAHQRQCEKCQNL